jgi:sec-independent protein translocase protein TatC
MAQNQADRAELLAQQSLVEHLTELRKRVIYSLFWIAAGFAASFSFSELIFNVVRAPIVPYLKTQSQGLVFTAPMDQFLSHLKVSIFAGVILTAPMWLYQVWKFVAPALYQKERRYMIAFIMAGTLLFSIGITFTYYLVLPAAFKFLLGFGGSVDVPMITINDYLSFFLTMSFAFGFAFEMPLILVLLGMLNVIDANFLRKFRRFAILIMAVLSGVITPPDALSMMMMLVPLMLLYELSILLLVFLAPKAKS